MKTTKYNNGEFTTKDSKHEKFLVHVNEKEDGNIVVSGHVNGITVAARIEYNWDDSSSIEYVIVDTLKGNAHHKVIELPESDMSESDIVSEVMVHVIGHALSTTGWYKRDDRMDSICNTIFLHTDSVLEGHHISLDLHRQYVNR